MHNTKVNLYSIQNNDKDSVDHKSIYSNSKGPAVVFYTVELMLPLTTSSVHVAKAPL